MPTLLYVQPFLLLINDLLSVITVITVPLADDVKMVSPRSQSSLLQNYLFDVWNLSVNWEFPINPAECNYIAIGRGSASPIILCHC